MKCETKSNNKISSWKCTHCAKEFKYESEMRRHEQSHVPQFECKVCSKKFSFLSALRRHEKQHERTGSVQCSKCGGHFRDETLLKRHIQYAHKGTYMCKKCSATFSSEYALSTHMKTHKPESERRYRCSFANCVKAFNFPHHLKHHELTHTNAKQYYCKVCGKGFIQSHHLKVHQKSHEPDSWLTCPVLDCKKKFVNEYARKRHLTTHSMELCTSRGSLKSSLYDKHTPESSYPNEKISEVSIVTLSVEGLDIKKDEEVDKIDPEINTCKEVLGGCIVNGDSKVPADCLCAQMTAVDEHCDLIVPDKNDKVKLAEDYISSDLCTDSENIDFNKCDGCECSKTCPSIQNKNDMPNIEYRIDGTVKISETFDIEIVKNIKAEKKINKEIDEQNVIEVKRDIKGIKSVLFNSCKDILGNCIVSGNSTIGEGCLCARMVMDDHQMIAQEIEDITPCPKSTWLN